MHIGLIGGIGPAATDYYYRRLISTFAGKKAALELTIVHADTPTLLGNLANNDAATQVAIFMKLTNRLAMAGADCVAITSIAGHFCIDAFKASSVLPVVDMISEVNRSLNSEPSNGSASSELARSWRRASMQAFPAWKSSRPAAGI
jgi:aspartate racemase